MRSRNRSVQEERAVFPLVCCFFDRLVEDCLHIPKPFHPDLQNTGEKQTLSSLFFTISSLDSSFHGADEGR